MFFLCHPNDSPSFLVMEPNSALFFLDATCAYLKNIWGPISLTFKKSE
jgi:hypothetical protein